MSSDLSVPDEAVAARVLRHFRVSLEERGYHADSAQQSAIQHLAEWLEEFLGARRSWLRKPPAGVYLWGSVGRGKSFVMDCFFAAVPIQAKRRVHFHSFLQELQIRMLAFAGQADPLVKVARQIAEQTRLLCFDEFHVHDIGDAMLLGRMLKVLVEEGVGMVCTSNYPPSGLCPNPLYRERFRPAIELLEKRFDVLPLDGGEDYRLRATPLENWGSYLWPARADDLALIGQRLGLDDKASFDQVLQVNHHPLRVHALEDDRAWLDFSELFERPRSAADYLWLIEHFPRMAVSGLGPLGDYPPDVSMRFLNFIDIAYDRQLRLQLFASVSLERLAEGGAAIDFARTLSRLRQLKVEPLSA
ncbi:cell division protein ZapE [Pseudomonas panipatensis]|uniref:Cell division protein ZapE n=1 Tax=Pseudomonas panipatensis TaxID=428992 RepID=A0A1G8FF66_9PSED|nr:cell division protein ZapE [Pseudomonas panipatensis]SDH80808.1 cell division protein ZapE [Pseudomonas panipatensis]SMP53969.1 cell division protein ZapE [Pseudomonas panipatensis]